MLLSQNIIQFVKDRSEKYECFKDLKKCPLCGNVHLRYLFTKWAFDHLECLNCALVFVAQEPSQEFLTDLYENLEYSSAGIRLVEKPRLERGEPFNFTMNVDQWYQYIVDEVLRWQQGGLWLDVGGGTGRLLRFVKNYAPGFETFLCESNTLACQLAEKYCSARIAAWEDMDEMNNTFQVISCIAVFEHIPDSVNFIKRLGKLLAPGGVLYMTMPRLGVLARRISKTALLDITPPLHLRFFSDKSLRYVENQLHGEISLCLFRQSHGKTFHIGHLFKPEWYEYGDVVPKNEGHIPTRIPLSIPSKGAEHRAYKLFSVIDKLMSPISEQIDGQRVLHAIWQKSKLLAASGKNY